MMPNDETYQLRFQKLTALLAEAPMVHGITKRSEGCSPVDVASEAAVSLLDIGESWGRISGDLMPRLLATDPRGEEFDDALGEIAEEWRHICYHILHTRLFEDVVNPDWK